MRIAVFGATGSTGRSLVAQALDEGHSVVAYARHPEKLGIAHDRLTVVEGDLSDVAAIERAVERVDGVISLLGQGMPQKGTPIAHGYAEYPRRHEEARGAACRRGGHGQRGRPS